MQFIVYKAPGLLTIHGTLIISFHPVTLLLGHPAITTQKTSINCCLFESKHNCGKFICKHIAKRLSNFFGFVVTLQSLLEGTRLSSTKASQTDSTNHRLFINKL